MSPRDATDFAATGLSILMNAEIQKVITEEGPENVKEILSGVQGRCPISRVVRKDGDCVDLTFMPNATFDKWDVIVRRVSAATIAESDRVEKAQHRANQQRVLAEAKKIRSGLLWRRARRGSVAAEQVAPPASTTARQSPRVPETKCPPGPRSSRTPKPAVPR